MTPGDNGWNAYQKKVLGDLERIEMKADKMAANISKLEVSVATLQVKARTAGAVAGSIPAIIAIIVSWYLRKG